jgi:protoheme IX farnesyltransferase
MLKSLRRYKPEASATRSSWGGPVVGLLRSLVQLTKPSIMLLVLLTGATALFMEGRFKHHPGKFLLVLLGLYLTGGAANALNQFFERDIDARMQRTRLRRPLPQKQLSKNLALGFAISIGVLGCLLFGFYFNWLSAGLALGTILFYSFFYTLWLKPNTHQNIVIGGAAGAMGPLIAWAAATGSLAMTPWILFLIIFFWTPPHFWALALCLKEDYRAANLPMLPVVKGDAATLRQIFYYTMVLVAISLSLLLIQFSWLYLLAATLLGGVFPSFRGEIASSQTFQLR